MHKPLLIFVLAPVCLMVLFASCSKNITCSDGIITINPIGFAKTDFDSAFVVRYKQDNTFDIIADSTSLIYYTNGDQDTGSLTVTSQNVVNGTHPAFLIPGYDYKIFLPAAGKTFSITNITQKGNKTQSYSGNGDNVSCINNVISCHLDGNTILAPNNLQSMPLNIVK